MSDQKITLTTTVSDFSCHIICSTFYMRKFFRETINTPCLFLSDGISDKANMVNFSRMGALVQTAHIRINKKYISIVYQNEKNEILQMLCAIKHITQKNKFYFYGLQFIGIESRKEGLKMIQSSS